MKRNVMLALVVMAAALLLAGGAVLAKDVRCTAGQPCVGTENADSLTGTGGADEINGRAGNDVIIGDDLFLDPQRADDDVIRGGRGADNIGDVSGGGSDHDQVFGGKGNDRIDVREGLGGGADTVDCGPGEDTVLMDVAVFNESDTAVNCEHVNP